MKKSLRSLLLVAALSICLTCVPEPAAAFIPQTGAYATIPVLETTLPSLGTFIDQVSTGSASQVTGLYVADVLAYPVIQQPAGQPGYVSPEDGKITQFGLATSHGSLGFLAHNTLAGKRFSEIKPDKLITVVYGDGQTTIYQVTEILRFQATRPTSPYSSFIDLSTNKTLTAADLFAKTYGVKDRLVLQTCITSGRVDTWGRLFIIASLYTPEPENNR